MKKIALFASGSGSNVQRIYEYFQHNEDIQIEIVMCNNSKAGVLKRCQNLRIKYSIFDKHDLMSSTKVLDMLTFYRIDFIALAGFLLLVPPNILTQFPKKIINIHPALLPKYGGKGFYGLKVHESVIKAKEKESGITIHYVNEKFDAGDIIFQATCPVEDAETPETLALKIHDLEYKYYPVIIEKLLMHDDTK